MEHEGATTITAQRAVAWATQTKASVNWRARRLDAAKFGKSREVALHATTIAALLAYSRRRDELIPRPSSPSFFISQAGTRLLRHVIDHTYRYLVRCADLQRVSPRSRPRLHDFRHTFAVRTVLDWYRDGGDVASRLPLLSTYLGHVNPSSTYWYLSATPELLALASDRLQRFLGGGFS